MFACTSQFSGSRSRIGVDGRAFPFAVKRVESAPRLRHRWTRGQRAVPCRLVWSPSPRELTRTRLARNKKSVARGSIRYSSYRNLIDRRNFSWNDIIVRRREGGHVRGPGARYRCSHAHPAQPARNPEHPAMCYVARENRVIATRKIILPPSPRREPRALHAFSM